MVALPVDALRLVSTRESEREPWSLAYDVLAGRARVRSLRLDDPSTIARLASAEGSGA
jgi:hypothetical protein